MKCKNKLFKCLKQGMAWKFAYDQAKNSNKIKFTLYIKEEVENDRSNAYKYLI